MKPNKFRNLFKYIFYIKDKFFNNRHNYKKINPSTKIKNIIVSHLIGYENLSFRNDFYFGDLANKLGKNNTIIILIDHIKLDQTKIKSKIKDNYIILSNNLGFFKELRIHFDFFFLFLFKNKKFFKLADLLKSIDNQRIANQVYKLVSKYEPRNILFTFEGNPYEKQICYKIRESKSKTKCIGYQFSILRKKKNAMFHSLDKKFVPDKIFTTSKYNEKILKKNFKKKLDIYDVGFLKKRENINFNKNDFKVKKVNNILVMPEGIPSEIDLFLQYCLNNNEDDIVFNLRLHPIFKNNSFLKNYNFSKNRNVNLSYNSLKTDFSKNNFILYRGTAGVIDAVNNKLIPIYLNKLNEITIDPLFSVNRYHKVNTKNNIKNFFKSLNNNKFKADRSRIFSFTKNYYTMPNITLIKNNLK